MKNTVLNETYELLREMRIVKNESEFAKDWLGKSSSYTRVLRCKDIEASTGCVAVCGIKLAHYGKRMIETEGYTGIGKRFLELSEQCNNEIKERAKRDWLQAA